MRFLAAGLTAITLLATAAPAARAQGRPIELGIDGALIFVLDDPTVVTLGVPIQQFRIGFHTTPTMSIEPMGSLNYLHVDDFDVTQLTLGVGVLFHRTADRTRNQTYFRPFVQFSSVSAEGTSESGAALGIGFGIKNPIANRLATRLEAFLAHDFDDGGSTSIGGLFGLSFFPR